jgi:hypothetical protein
MIPFGDEFHHFRPPSQDPLWPMLMPLMFGPASKHSMAIEHVSGDIGDQLNPEINVILRKAWPAFRSRPISVTMTENPQCFGHDQLPLR